MWKVTLDGEKLVFTPFFDWDPDKIREELQDLKLENDRLQQRDKLMYNFIKSVAVSRYEWVSVQADEILRRLEDLG